MSFQRPKAWVCWKTCSPHTKLLKKREMGIVHICWGLQLQEIFFQSGLRVKMCISLPKCHIYRDWKQFITTVFPLPTFLPRKPWTDIIDLDTSLAFFSSRFLFLPLFGERLVLCEYTEFLFVSMRVCVLHAVCLDLYVLRDHPPRLC